MIFQAGNVHESASLFNLKEKQLIEKTEGFEPTTRMVQYTTLTTRPQDLLDESEIIVVRMASTPT